jgi:hypothetical protein
MAESKLLLTVEGMVRLTTHRHYLIALVDNLDRIFGV